MISKLNLHECKNEFVIKSDFAGEHPIYVYNDNDVVFYCTNICKLLSHVQTKLKISNKGISFLLKNGVIPTPNSIYENLYILGIGDSVCIHKRDNKFHLKFNNKFIFSHDNKNNSEVFDTARALDLIYEATVPKLNKNANNFFFQSAGKDSNTILLALKKKNFSNITLLTHKSKGKLVESHIASKIAKANGFGHQKLIEPNTLEYFHKNSLENYFYSIPLPSTDTVSLAYPLYENQVNFTESNIIDGMGNDIYIGHIPSHSEFNNQRIFSKLTFLRSLLQKLPSENYYHSVGSLRVEWTGLIGFLNSDCNDLYTGFIDPDLYWENVNKSYLDLNYLEVRARVRGAIIDQEIFTRKIRNFAHVHNANLILPWMDKDVANYFFNLDNKYLFDEKLLKNKLILRQLLKDELDLDSDQLGKYGFNFDYWSILQLMKPDVVSTILDCKLWELNSVEKILKRLYKSAQSNGRFKNRARTLIQRLYLISAWYNLNKYIN